LTLEDLETLAAPPGPAAGPSQLLAEPRTRHHQLAQYMSMGMTNVEISRILGYSMSRLSILRTDPMFQELLAHYEQNAQVAFTEVLDRRKQVGMQALEEIQSRMDADPERFSNDQLFSLVEVALGKANGAGGPVQGGSGTLPAISLTFVAATNGAPAHEIEGNLA
jgi:hypothetical protein